MSYTLTSTSRESFRGGVSGATPHAGYETATKLNRVLRYTFTAPAEGVSAVSFAIPGLARADQNTDYNGLYFAVTVSDSSHRSANAADGAAGAAAPVNGNGTTYVVSGSCAVNIAPHTKFYLWFFPAHTRYSLWNFINVASAAVTCEAGAASFARVDSRVETLGSLNAAVGSATLGMSHRLSLCDGSAELLRSEPFTASTALTVPRTIFAAYPDKTSLALTARLQAYSDAACTAPYGPPAESPVTVTADQGMRPVLPEAAVTLTIVNPNSAPVGAVVGQSRVKFSIDPAKFDFSAAPGASAAALKVSGSERGSSDYEYLSEILNNASTKFDIILTDSRGRSCTLTQTVTAQDYALPSIVSCEGQRCGAAGTADDGGHYLRLLADVIISDLGGRNSASLSAAWRYRGGEYGAETGLTPGEASVVGGTIDPDRSVELRFTLTDLLGRSAHAVVTVSGRRWAMKFREDGMGVGFGMAPEQGSALELPPGWKVFVGALPVQAMAYPPGAVFWTMSEADPAEQLGFGEWERVNSALPAAWQRKA